MMAKKNRVLIVDADPQCNLTGLVLRDDFEAYYTDEVTRTQNIKDGVAPAFDGKPVPIAAASCVRVERSPKLFLLPGHANLSEYDAALTFAQTANNAIVTLQNLPGAFSQLLKLTEERYEIEYTIIDLNPGLSAIKSKFLSHLERCYRGPTSPDPFSLMALSTLKTVLPRSVTWKRDAAVFFADSAYPRPRGSNTHRVSRHSSILPLSHPEIARQQSLDRSRHRRPKLTSLQIPCPRDLRNSDCS